jgi:hypothetical protein
VLEHGADEVVRPLCDEAFLVAVNIAKLPSVPRQILKDIPRPPYSPAGTIERQKEKRGSVSFDVNRRRI